MVALCGELPANQISRVPGSTSYNKFVLTQLKRADLLRPCTKNGLRGYRLTNRAKTLLRSSDPEKYDFFLSGFGEYDVLKYEVGKRLRIHRIAQTLLTMLNADVLVHRTEKAAVFAPVFKPPDVFYVPAFYTSREVKALGDETVKIHGSRMVGVLLSENEIFAVYNFTDSIPKFDVRSETRINAFLEHTLCHRRFRGYYRDKDLHGLMFANSSDTMAELWAAADKSTLKFLLQDGGCDHFYFLTNDHHGEVLLQLLCDPGLRDIFHNELLQELTPVEKDSYLGCDALDGQNRQVMFACLPDLPRLYRFISRLSDRGKQGVIVCFDFQADALRAWGGESIVLRIINYTDFERRYFPSTNLTDVKRP